MGKRRGRRLEAQIGTGDAKCSVREHQDRCQLTGWEFPRHQRKCLCLPPLCPEACPSAPKPTAQSQKQRRDSRRAEMVLWASKNSSKRTPLLIADAEASPRSGTQDQVSLAPTVSVENRPSKPILVVRTAYRIPVVVRAYSLRRGRSSCSLGFAG